MYFIRDLDSRNGTFVNEKAVSEELLRIGDQVRVGNTVSSSRNKMAQLRDSSSVMADEQTALRLDKPHTPFSSA